MQSEMAGMGSGVQELRARLSLGDRACGEYVFKEMKNARAMRVYTGSSGNIGGTLTHRDFIAIGTSSGGVDTLRALVSRLPRDLQATVAIVLHIGAHDSLLPSLLSSSGPLHAVHAKDGETYLPGRIYVAPPDRHLIVEGAVLRLMCGAKQNFARPAIDPLFRSVAVEMGRRAIGVILTGLLDDGAAGLDAIRSCGGTTIVQDPEEAFASDMPLHAVPYADFVLSLHGLAHRLIELTTSPLGDSTNDEVARRRAVEQVAGEQRSWIAECGALGPLSRMTGPPR